MTPNCFKIHENCEVTVTTLIKDEPEDQKYSLECEEAQSGSLYRRKRKEKFYSYILLTIMRRNKPCKRFTIQATNIYIYIYMNQKAAGACPLYSYLLAMAQLQNSHLEP